MFSTLRVFSKTILTICILTASLFPMSSQALTIISGGKYQFYTRAGFWYNDPTPAAIVICMLTLPVCLLGDDKKNAEGIDSEKLVSDQILQAKGYNQEEIDRLKKAQDHFLGASSKKNVLIQVQENETYKSFYKDLKNIDPQVSEEYIQFLAEQFGISSI